MKRSLPMYRGPGARDPFLTFDFAELDDEAADAGVLFLEQGQTERLLLEAVRVTGLCELRFATGAVALEQRTGAVTLTLRRDGAAQRLQAEYVVGADGTNGVVRDALGLPFDGFTFPLRATLADVHIEDARDALSWPRFHNGDDGFTAAQRLAPRHWRIARVEGGDPAPGEEVTPSELERRVGACLSVRQRQGNERRHAGQDAHKLVWKLPAALGGATPTGCSPPTTRSDGRSSVPSPAASAV